MWKDILFILVAMVAGITIYRYISMSSPTAMARYDDPRTALPVIVQKDADAFSAGPGLSPGPAALADKRAPYALLDKLPVYRAPSGTSRMTSRACYKVNPDNSHMLSSYSQQVNNYMRDYPDNCSTPFEELGFSVYIPQNVTQSPVDQY
jgi:hypothetical protein